MRSSEAVPKSRRRGRLVDWVAGCMGKSYSVARSSFLCWSTTGSCRYFACILVGGRFEHWKEMARKTLGSKFWWVACGVSFTDVTQLCIRKHTARDSNAIQEYYRAESSAHGFVTKHVIDDRSAKGIVRGSSQVGRIKIDNQISRFPIPSSSA